MKTICMKKIKKPVALVIAVVLAVSLMVPVALAANYIANTTAIVRSTASTSGTALGQIYDGDVFVSSSSSSASWYYGYPGTATIFYEKFGKTYGYVRSDLFY